MSERQVTWRDSTAPCGLSTAFMGETDEAAHSDRPLVQFGVILDAIFNVLTESQQLRVLEQLGWKEVK